MISSGLVAVVPSLALAAGWGTYGTVMNRRLNAARHDPLTGLPTRATWFAQARRQVQRRPQGAVVLLIDLDDFKSVNDHYGHDAGDAVLAAQARRLADHFHGSGLVGRLGGDEFAALVYPGPTYDLLKDDLRTLAVDELTWPVMLPDGTEIDVRASVGAAVYTELVAPSLSRALKLADAMMYRCKHEDHRWLLAAPGQDPQIDPRPVRRERHHGQSAATACTP
jgi:diguanylate cyclase (GGDEF)-like protein